MFNILYTRVDRSVKKNYRYICKKFVQNLEPILHENPVLKILALFCKLDHSIVTILIYSTKIVIKPTSL
jgi:hypothetical protein